MQRLSVLTLRSFGLLLLLMLFPSISLGGTVKQTNSGLCHPPESSYYDRIKNYQAFDSIDDCLASDGRLPKSLKHKTSAGSEAPDAYKRSRFGSGWLDFDSDGQNSRAEALIIQSTIPVQFASPDEKRVVHGRWISPFTGNPLTDASKLDADHVVPLRFAWEYGAKGWPKNKRRQFANDQRNIWMVEASLNRSKGARDITEWLPPRGRCAYIARFVRISKIYSIELPEQKRMQYQSLVDVCKSGKRPSLQSIH